jgi:hypothetical protein
MPIITKSQARKMGIPKKTLQTVLISRNNTINESKKWLADNHYANSYYRTTTNFRRWMQTPPIAGSTYYSKILPNGVELVFQIY